VQSNKEQRETSLFELFDDNAFHHLKDGNVGALILKNSLIHNRMENFLQNNLQTQLARWDSTK
jgi:uncharacterized protein (UPF0262 family)